MSPGISQQNRFQFFQSWCKRSCKNEPEGASHTNWGVKGHLLPTDVSIQMSKGGGNCTSIWWLKQWFGPPQARECLHLLLTTWPPRPHPSPPSSTFLCSTVDLLSRSSSILLTSFWNYSRHVKQQWNSWRATDAWWDWPRGARVEDSGGPLIKACV